MELAFEDFGHVLVTFEAQVVALADQDQFSNYTVAFVATFTIIVLEGFVGVFCPRRILLVFMAFHARFGLEGCRGGGHCQGHQDGHENQTGDQGSIAAVGG